MDAQRFDAIAKALASGVARRGVLRAVAGAALGGVAAALGGEPAEAARRGCAADPGRCRPERCEACDADADRCVSACERGTCERCQDGTCVSSCAGGEICCGRRCVDPATDSHHCGFCGGRCDTRAGYVCVDGSCDCPPGEIACDGRVCVRPCRPGQVHSVDTCRCVDCPAGTTPLNDRACCFDEVHCGEACGRSVCGPDELCCDGRCRAVLSDPDACGSCDQRCADVKPGSACLSGACDCPPGRSACFDAVQGREVCIENCPATHALDYFGCQCVECPPGFAQGETAVYCCDGQTCFEACGGEICNTACHHCRDDGNGGRACLEFDCGLCGVCDPALNDCTVKCRSVPCEGCDRETGECTGQTRCEACQVCAEPELIACVSDCPPGEDCEDGQCVPV